MDLLIDLQSPDHLTIQKIEQILFVSSVTFLVVPSSFLEKKIGVICTFLVYLEKRPLIKTLIKVLDIDKYEGKQFPRVVVGGTFDHLHLGHQILLLYTVLSAKNVVIIRVTSNQMLLKKKNRQILESLPYRIKEVESFVKSIRPDIEVDIGQLNDPFGMSIYQENLDALVVSEETLPGGEKINQIRIGKGLRQLNILICPTVNSSQKLQNKLSSSIIREYLLKKNEFSLQDYVEYQNYWKCLIKKIQKYGGFQIKQEVTDRWWFSIFKKYSEYWRFYHTNGHILNLIRIWNGQLNIKIRQNMQIEHEIAIQLSIFFHDIVYQPNLHNNEEKSLEEALEFIHQIFKQVKSEKLIEKVTIIILQTKYHKPSIQLSQIMYDLDMGILNQNLSSYKRYAKKIKQEYAPLHKQEYGAKRIQFLQSMITEGPHFSYEASNYRSNIEWEIACLQHNDL